MISYDQFKAGIEVFKRGKSVANPTAWKKRQVNANTLSLLIIALVALGKAYGYTIPVSDEAAVSIAGGIIAVVNIVCTMVSTEKIGIGEAASMQTGDVVDMGSVGNGDATINSGDEKSVGNALRNERVGYNPADNAGG